MGTVYGYGRRETMLPARRKRKEPRSREPREPKIRLPGKARPVGVNQLMGDPVTAVMLTEALRRRARRSR